MTKRGYTVVSNFATTARANGKEMPISPRHSIEICNAIKGMKVENAITFLEDVIDLKKAVPFRRHTGGVPHRKGKGMAAGRYPKKAASYILKLVEQARNNAEFKEITGDLMIVHAAAHRGQPWMSWRPRAHGRSSPRARETVNIEIIVEEFEE